MPESAHLCLMQFFLELDDFFLYQSDRFQKHLV